MKLQNILPAVLLMMESTAQAQTAITVNGQVVGNVDSCMVTLVDCENPQESKALVSSKFVGENFSLSAQVGKTPRFARLSFSVRNQKGFWGWATELRLFLDGSPITVKIDKNVLEQDVMWQKKQALINQPDGKIIVEAGKAQASYADYLAFVRASSISADSASYAEASAWFANNGDEDAIKDYKQRNEAAAAVFEAKRNDYIRLHPDAPITAALVAQYAYKPFSYDLEVFNQQYVSLANNPDTMHVNFIQRNLDYFRSHANGAIYTDFIAETKDGKSVQLSSLMKPGKMMLIDFWASWCVPCRAKMKELRKVYDQLKERNITVLSISKDEKRSAWEKASKEDDVIWTNTCDLKPFRENSIGKAYKVTNVPQLFVISPEGVIATQNPSLKEILKTSPSKTTSKKHTSYSDAETIAL